MAELPLAVVSDVHFAMVVVKYLTYIGWCVALRSRLLLSELWSLRNIGATFPAALVTSEMIIPSLPSQATW